MATLITVNKSGKIPGYVIQWYGTKKRRHTLYLGGRRYNKKIAEETKGIVEILCLHHQQNTWILDKKTTAWFESAPADLCSKLAKVGLIAIEEPKTCQMIWDTFLKSNEKRAASTKIIYRNSLKHFFASFSPAEIIGEITAERLLEWKQGLCSRLAEATVATIQKTVKAVFNFAVAQGWLQRSPMQNIPLGSFVNRKNDRIISKEEYSKLLVFCPNQEWRVIIALARYGGLRCPSELKQLRYSDIDWEKQYFLVHSPKTERHHGHQERRVPLFPELRKELGPLLLEREPKDDDFVIQDFQGKAEWSLGPPFQKIARDAGLGRIARPFANMRASRSNEIERKYGSLKESLWLGHSERVKKDHYYRLTDEDFLEAAESND